MGLESEKRLPDETDSRFLEKQVLTLQTTIVIKTEKMYFLSPKMQTGKIGS